MNTGRFNTMRCDEIQRMLSGYLDGELDENGRQAVERHLATCANCSAEYQKLKKLAEVTNAMKFKEPAKEVWDNYWSGIYNRLERTTGWTIFVLGIAGLAAWATYAFVTDPTIEAVKKVLIGAPIIGLAVLLISVIRERIYKSKFDRYSKEVKR
jgi:hypothetical protein